MSVGATDINRNKTLIIRVERKLKFVFKSIKMIYCVLEKKKS